MLARDLAQHAAQFLAHPWSSYVAKQILRLSSIQWQCTRKWTHVHQILGQHLTQLIGQTLYDVLGVATSLPRLVIHGQKTHPPIDDIYVLCGIYAVANLDGSQFGSTRWL